MALEVEIDSLSSLCDKIADRSCLAVKVVLEAVNLFCNLIDLIFTLRHAKVSCSNTAIQFSLSCTIFGFDIVLDIEIPSVLNLEALFFGGFFKKMYSMIVEYLRKFFKLPVIELLMDLLKS